MRINITPIPWTIQGLYLVDGKGNTIAKFEQAIYDTDAHDKRKNDMMLIKSAPKLYGALNNLLDAIYGTKDMQAMILEAESALVDAQGIVIP
jgi:hypothetical protein